MDPAIASAPPQAWTTADDVRPWRIALVVTLVLILLVNPVGYLGGGLDDWQYLNAARCWAEQGPCLPRDHWQGRWPLIAPMAASIALLGESRLSVGLPSLLYAIGCLALLDRLGNRLAGPPVGTMAALFLLAVPIFGIELLDPNVGTAELLFLLVSASFVEAYARKRRGWQAFAAGLAWALAFQVRETAVVALPLLIIAAWVLARRDWPAMLLAALGAALPMAAEMLVFWQQTGDPLWRRHLSVAHTQISSSELLGPVDRSQQPFFNPAYIANWRHEPGVHLHWLVDGLANLALNLKAGTTIALSLVFAPLLGRKLASGDRKILISCLIAALWWACALIYILAIDPKPRMMLAVLALSSTATAILVRHLIRQGSNALALTIVATIWLAGLSATLAHAQLRTSEPRVAVWAKRYPGQIEIAATSRRNLALVPEAAEFASLRSQRPYLVLRLDDNCLGWARRNFGDNLSLIDQVALSPFEQIAPDRGQFCLFRYNRPTSAEAIVQAK